MSTPDVPRAVVGPYQPKFDPTPEIQTLLDRLRGMLAERDEYRPHVDELMSLAEPYVILAEVERAWTAEETDFVRAHRKLPPSLDPELNLPMGGSRFGFVPDLPPGVAWPQHDGQPLMFLAQIDCSSLPHWPGSSLPVEGWLYVFATFPELRLMPEKPWRYTVFHHVGPRDALVRQPKLPKGYVWGDVRTMNFAAVPVVARLAVDIDRQLVTGFLDYGEAHELSEVTRELNLRSGETEAGHLLGQVDHQADTATQDLNSLIEVRDLHPVVSRFAEQPGGPGDDWIHFLTIHSVGSMEWSDAGLLLFLMRRSDLTSGDFSNVVLSMSSN
jgi:hypothetical protein